jgi:hypothetical protein
MPDALRRRSLRECLALASLLVVLVPLLISCATTQSRNVSLGKIFPPRSADCSIAVYKDGLPTRAFERISRLDVHIERTHFSQSDFESALPELKRQACLSGADAIIEIQERTASFRFENRAYHVTAVGIKFKE